GLLLERRPVGRLGFQSLGDVLRQTATVVELLHDGTDRRRPAAARSGAARASASRRRTVRQGRGCLFVLIACRVTTRPAGQAGRNGRGYEGPDQLLVHGMQSPPFGMMASPWARRCLEKSR